MITVLSTFALLIAGVGFTVAGRWPLGFSAFLLALAGAVLYGRFAA